MNERRNSFFCVVFAYTIQAVTADTYLYTYYQCKGDLDITPNAQFTISCADKSLVINVESALLGYSDQYNLVSGSCPWTDKTSTTCQFAAPGYNCGSTFCGDSPCNCTRATAEPATRCNGRNTCSFPQTITSLSYTNFCVLNPEANFIVVNYTCVPPIPSSTSTSATTTTTTTTKITATSTTSTILTTTMLRPTSSKIAEAIFYIGSTTKDNSQEPVLTTIIASRSTLSTGAIVGIVVGCTALSVIIVLIVVCFVYLLHRSPKQEPSQNSATAMNSGGSKDYEHLNKSTMAPTNQTLTSLQKTENSRGIANRTYEPLDESTMGEF